MKIQFTCRQTSLTAELRSFAEDRLRRLERYLDDDTEVSVVLSVEKHRHEAEMNLVSARQQFTGAAITTDLFTSLSLVLDKIKKQLRRDKRRRTDRRRRGTRAARERSLGRDPRSTRPIHRSKIRAEAPAAQPMSVEEAALDLEHSDKTFLVFRNVESDRMGVVYRRQDGHIGLIEAD